MPDRLIKTTHVVVNAYQSSVVVPITLQKGDTIRVGQTYEGDPDWRGWVWCENDAGQSGWVPEALIAKRGAMGRVLGDYTARELSVPKGETLCVIRMLNGWAWARRINGETGWVPLRHLQPIAGNRSNRHD